MLKGGCYCGRVRYEPAGEPLNESKCHSIFRRITGARPSWVFSVLALAAPADARQPTRFRGALSGQASGRVYGPGE